MNLEQKEQVNERKSEIRHWSKYNMENKWL